ncbi:MAG: hypothetical protein J6V21_01040 [Alistipes sp.]|nr:hypothetical protein [Alistipes sp.]
MRAFLICITALLLSVSASAQDLLVKTNGEQMRVKVLKITKKKVEFVRQGTELPVYSLPISDISYIEYPLGDRDTFGKENKSAPTPTPVRKELQVQRGPAPMPDGSLSAPLIVKEEEVVPQGELYAIGDIYDKDGVRGIVVLLQDGGRHGVVMSLDEACLAWCKLHRKVMKDNTLATNNSDGMVNMQAIEKYIVKHNFLWSDFPAFEWCRNKGEGWYLPSINELWCAGTMYMGGTRTASNRTLRKRFNDNLKGAGGVPVSDLMFYHSSTEDKNAQYSLYSHMSSEQPYTNSGFKGDELFVRAFHKF